MRGCGEIAWKMEHNIGQPFLVWYRCIWSSVFSFELVMLAPECTQVTQHHPIEFLFKYYFKIF